MIVYIKMSISFIWGWPTGPSKEEVITGMKKLNGFFPLNDIALRYQLYWINPLAGAYLIHPSILISL